MIITLNKQSIGYGKHIYVPLNKGDKFLMQHCMNEDLECLNDEGLEKCRYLAISHDWNINIV